MVDLNAVNLRLRMTSKPWFRGFRQSPGTMITPNAVPGVEPCAEPTSTVTVELEFRELHVERNSLDQFTGEFSEHRIIMPAAYDILRNSASS